MAASRIPGSFGKDDSPFKNLIVNEIEAFERLFAPLHELAQQIEHAHFSHPTAHLAHHTGHAAPVPTGRHAPVAGHKKKAPHKHPKKAATKPTPGPVAEILVNDPRIQAMLDVLGYTEGTGSDYGKVVNGTVIASPNFPDLVGKKNVSVTDLSKHPNILVQVNSSIKSTAAGRYQFLKGTWDGLGMADFSARSQDVAAVKLMKRRGMIAPLLEGNVAEAVHKGAPEWASLPKKAGGSYYGGQTARSLEQIEAKYNEALKQHGGSPATPSPSSTPPGPSTPMP